MTTPIFVHFIQVDLYSGDKKKAFTVRITRGSYTRGSNTAKIGRWDHRVFSIIGWS